MTNIAILGAGMAGFGAAHRLHSEQIGSVLYEQKAHYGGHTSSHRLGNGFVFDEGPHVSFTKVERLQQLLADNIDHDYQILSTRVNNYWKGTGSSTRRSATCTGCRPTWSSTSCGTSSTRSTMTTGPSTITPTG